MIRLGLLLCPLFLLAFPSILLGQKVALVLSGGGAKGAAHIGVIKALEEHQIPIDYVVGTSMGGVVGGFYAAGFTPAQMEEMARSAAFQDWVRGRIHPEAAYYFVQPHASPQWLNLGLNVDSLSNPFLVSNVAADNSLNFSLAQHLSQASIRAKGNFDSLLVPFRTTGAEIFTEELVVLKSGRLNDAVRVTMTVPVFYRPIKYQNRYLFDGGMYNNFPIDIAQKDFNPDVIIGVNVSEKTFKEYPYDRDEHLITQVLIYGMLGKTDTISDPNYLYVFPEMEGYSSLSFAKVGAIIDSGYVATLAQMDRIKARIGRRMPPDTLQAARQAFLADTLPLRFGGVAVKGFSAQQQRYISKFIGMEAEGADFASVRDRYFRLVSHPYFKQIIPNFGHTDSLDQLTFELEGKGSHILQVAPGGLFATREIGYLYLGLDYTHLGSWLTQFRANLYRGSFYKSWQLAPRFFLPTKPHLYLEPRITFNTWDFIDSNDILAFDEVPTLLEQVDRSIQLEVGVATGIKNKLVLRGGYFFNADRFSNTPELSVGGSLDQLDLDGWRGGLYWERYTLNRRQYAFRGGHWRVQADFLAAREHYEPGSTSMVPSAQTQNHRILRLKAQAEQYLPWGRFSLGYRVEGLWSNQKPFSNYQATMLYAPAAFPMADSRSLLLQDFRAFAYAMGGLRAVYQFGKQWEGRLEGHVFMPFWRLQPGPRQETLMEKNQAFLALAASANLVFHSSLGPLAIRFNYALDPEDTISILGHIGFLLYNDRAWE